MPNFVRSRSLAAISSGAALSPLLLALSSPALAQAPVTVSVDATSPGAPIERVWAFHGYDEINYTTLPEGEALLGAIAALHSAPVHVRTHFLLNTGDGTPAMKWGSTNVYTEDASGNPIYTWQLTDGIMDTITRAGAFPFVELGFMPEALSSHPIPYQNSATTALDGGCFSPPSDYTKWASLVGTWATHAAQRYPDVAAAWLWELWNEPDIGYWHGSFDEYAELYDYTEAALHDVIPNAVLGGPAVSNPNGGFLGQFLEHCATGANAVTGAAGTRLDLVTFHAKGGVAIVGDHVEMDLGNQLRLERAGFNAVSSVPAFTQTPIYVTEADPDGCAACPLSASPADAYRNSPAYGAYEIAMMKHSLELESELGVKLGGLLTWAFTFPATPFFAGYRTLATNGIDLPVLSAFKLLGKLNGSRLPLTSSGALALDDVAANGVRGDPEIDGMATLSGGAVQILLWNYHDDIVSVANAPVHLTVTVPADFGASAHVSHLRVDESHGDAYTAWLAQGMPESPSAEQVHALELAMEPGALVPDATVAVDANGSVALAFDLPRFGVSLVTLTPTTANDAAQGDAHAPAGAAANGCACRASSPSDQRVNDGAWLGVGIIACALARRQSLRSGSAIAGRARA